MSDTSEGRDILQRMRELVEQSTWLVYFREACPPHAMFRGPDPISGRSVIIANPADREQVLAGLRTLNVPHELAEPEEAPMGAHDAEEMLEAAKADVVRQEREIAHLRAVVARVADYAREIREEASNPDDAGLELGQRLVAEQVAHIVDGAADPTRDLSPLSGVMVNGKRLTWQELLVDRDERLRKLEACATMLSDLDRNRNGRHEGDVDSGTVSLGNPHLATGQTIGYSLHGRFAYVVPEPRLRGNVEAWKQPRP